MALKDRGSVSIVSGQGIPAIPPSRPLQFAREVGENDADFNKRIAARLTELMEVSVSPVKMYGTEPNPLPAELPAGTRCHAAGHRPITASSSVILRNSNQYWGRWSDPEIDTWVEASIIDWANTPVVGHAPTSPDPTTFEEQAALARQAFAEAEATAGVAPLVGPVRENRVTSFGDITITINGVPAPIGLARINYSYVDDPE